MTRAQQRNAAVYLVKEVVAETPWHGLYRGKKVFRNAKSDGSGLEEADDEECLDVLLKTIIYTRLGSREYVKMRRDQMWSEAKKVLGFRQTNLLPEPLDFLEIPNTQDAFTFACGAQTVGLEPILVLENIAGVPLAKWRSAASPDPKRAFHVAAEILHYLDALHSEDFVVNAVHPGAFWIDDIERIYHLATDCVVRTAQTGSLAAERFPYGFAAPEAFDKGEPVGQSADLYSWAALTYFLVTGESPATIAAAQGTRTASFQPTHRARLTAMLQQSRAQDVSLIASWLGITGRRFQRGFPESLVEALFACLDHHPESRPTCANVLRQWCEKAPPPSIPAAVAIRSRSGRASLVVAATGLDKRMELVVRRGQGKPPREPRDGIEVYDGPICRLVNDVSLKTGNGAFQDAKYSLFCRDKEDGSTSYSRGTIACAVDLARPETLQQFLEPLVALQAAANDLLNERNIPAPIELLSVHEELGEIVRLMLASTEPLIRRWAVTLVEATVASSRPHAQALAIVKERGLRDALHDIRMAAARALLVGRSVPDVKAVVEIASILGGEAVGNRIRMTRALEALGLSAPVVKQAISAIEGDRVIRCSECQGTLKARELDEHLRGKHGYVECESRLLPLGSALRQLWQRLLERHDPKACAQLAFLLVERHRDRSVKQLQSALLSQLSKSWLPVHLGQSAQNREAHCAALATCLRASRTMIDASWILLSADSPELRELGREVVVPSVAACLADDASSADFFEKQVHALCPQGTLDEKVNVCRALVQHGASAMVACRCIQAIEEEREVPCSRCAVLVTRRLLPRHERLTHNIYSYRGQNLGWSELVERVGVNLICSEPMFDEAQLCLEVLRERIGSEPAIVRFADILSSGLRQLPNSPSKHQQVSLAASVLAQLEDAERLTCQLLEDSYGDAVELGLALVALLRGGFANKLLTRALSAIRCGELNSAVRSSAVAAILQQDQCRSSDRERALQAFISPEPDKLAAIERLQELASQVGRVPEIGKLCRELEETLRVQCPVCHEVMTGAQMRLHAQSVHRRVWEGRRLRSAWSVAEDCLEQCLSESNGELLKAGEQYAQLDGGEEGLRAFMRLAMRRGVGTDRYLTALLHDASQRHATLCRQCYALLGSPCAVTSIPVTINSSGSLVSDYLTIERRSSLFLVEDVIRLREGIWSGEQPSAYVPPQGIMTLLGASFGTLFLVLIVLLLMGFEQLSYAIPVVAAIGALSVVGTHFFYRPRHATALSIAWDHVVPTHLGTDAGPEFAAFLLGLARRSEQDADRLRERQVEKAASSCLGRFRAGKLSYEISAALYRLLLIDVMRNDRSGAKALRLLAELLHRWQDRQLPSNFLDIVTADGALIDRLSAAQQRWLRWRLLRECLNVGLTPTESASLSELSRTFQRVLAKPEPIAVNTIALAFAALKLDDQTLEACGAESALQQCLEPDARRFESAWDLVLWSSDGDFSVRPQGLFFRDLCLQSLPGLAIRANEQFVQTGWTYQRADGGPDRRYKHNPPVGYYKRVGYTLQVNGRSLEFPRDPTPLANAIRQWCNLYFEHLEPASHEYLRRPSSGCLGHLGSGVLTRCEACGAVQRFVEGQLGGPC